MRYMMLIYSRETADGLSPAQTEASIQAHRSVMEEASRKGILVAVEGLKSAATATTVRVHDSEVITSDGPFAETKEQLAGFYILECANLDEAIAWAKRIPTACKGAPGCIEIRPVAVIPRPS